MSAVFNVRRSVPAASLSFNTREDVSVPVVNKRTVVFVKVNSQSVFLQQIYAFTEYGGNHSRHTAVK